MQDNTFNSRQSKITMNGPQSKIVAIIQARMSSTRLPGKVLMALAGEPLLVRVFERVRRAETLDEVVVATTVEPSDDPIVELCRALSGLQAISSPGTPARRSGVGGVPLLGRCRQRPQAKGRRMPEADKQ